jgi:hypothetical protein
VRPWLTERNDGFVMSGRPMYEPNWEPGDGLSISTLDPKVPIDMEPVTLGSVIAMNETYMDVTDWAYMKLGLFEVFWSFMGLMPAVFLSHIAWVTYVVVPPGRNALADTAIFIFMMILFLPSVVWFGWSMFKTATGYTHYPVRLDRKKQMVHVFRHHGEGGVLSLPWRDITFGIGTGKRQFSPAGTIMGYVKKDDGDYDYFRLGVTYPSTSALYQHWEYFRRYMDEGPDAVPEPPILLPIDGKREPFRVGAHLTWFTFGPFLSLAALSLVLTVPGSLLRWFIMHVTRRVPRWPQWLIDSTPISPDDRFAFKPVKPLEVPLWVAFVVTIGVLALDTVLVQWFIGSLRR